MRIVSLVPSLTELLCDLGLKESIVGCTQFCVHPVDLHRSASLVGGTKNPNIELIASLSPSHILVNTEENRGEDITKLRQVATVVETFPTNPDDVLEMIGIIATAFGLPNLGQGLSEKISQKISDLRNLGKAVRPTKSLYFIWRDPWMLAGKNTYITALLELMRVENIAWHEERYPQVDLSDIKNSGAELLLLSSEPWPFRKRDAIAMAPYLLEGQKIMWIDGRSMSWYGSTTLDALLAIELYLKSKDSPLLKPII